MTRDARNSERSEELLRESEARLKRAEKLARMGHYSFEADHNNAAWSDGMKELWGFDPDSNPPFADFLSRIHPDDRERVRTEFDRRAEAKQPFEFEYRIARPDGAEITVHSQAEPTIDPATGKLRYFGTIVDITERQRAEAAVRVSEARLQRVINATNDGVWDWNQITGESYHSPRWKNIFGYRDDELPESEGIFFDRLHPDDKPALMEILSSRMKTGGSFSKEIRVRHRNGSYRWVLARGEAVRDAQGIIVGMAGTTTDITERKLSELRISASLQEKETLLREVHHRVKNNLQIISSLLYFQAKKAQTRHEMAGLREGEDRLRAMILVHEQLYRSEDLHSINLGTYLGALARQLQRSFSDVSNNIHIGIEADEVTVAVETALPCGMIVTELVTNAIKYAYPSGDGGEVRVRIARGDSGFTLSVTDTGAGLPAGFDLEQTESFGLKLVQNLADQLNAILTLVPGKGTAISLHVPHVAELGTI